ncbi:MAG: fibro-slime domain-containing protein [Subdoligranulum sp.]
MAMALPVYAEVDPLPDAPDEVELLEDEPGTASGEDTVPPEQNAATPVPDAATPEPEQSAGPEQPAPTETPEPTAEPTPTPEPAATATATPVPTVTPTATPEPTEQPQMDAEEAEDMDRALGVSTQSNQFTVYFAVPSSWEVTKNSTITFNAKRGNGSQEKDGEIGEQPMSLVPDKITSKGQRIYKINGDQTICPWGGYVWMQFTLDKSHKVKVTAPPEENNTTNHFVKVDVFNDKYYDGDANSVNGDVAWNDAVWADASALPNPAVHTAFGGQKMVFENLSDSDLANVTAVFTEQNSSRNTTATETVTIGNVAKDKKPRFEIPTSACSSVQFFAENGSKPLSESYNFYEQGTDGNTFLYNASKKYCFTYKGNNQSTWGTPQGKQGKQVIYFDATFSGLSYENETSETHGAIGCGMPTNDGKLWCYLTGDGKDPITKEMSQLKDTNIWYYEVPEGYTKIRFASWAVVNENAADNGNGTAMMDIPADLSEPCFFADASDDVIYKGGNRRGYWAEKGTLRDAETWKNPETKVVDIKSVPFTEKPNTKYVTSTLYDYYTDYELNGKNRNSYDSYDQNFPALSHRNWVPFRQFDQAISDYYQSYNKNTGKSIIYPIYTGHFQPDTWDKKFVEIASTLNLYGWSSYDIFIAANNSNYDIRKNEKKNSYAFQGIVANERDSDGDIVMNGTTLKEPHFNEKFLTSQNSKNAKLGEVYHNVEFPFTQEEVFVEPEQNGQKKGEGVKYWWFDSSKTSLYLRKDTNSDQLYLGNDSTGETTAKYTSDASLNVDSANSTGSVSTKYGFFPFNENTTSKSAARYNYGYGAKLEIPFTLTSTGTVEDKYKNEIPIRFYFSGDDDVWVFIDNQLVLDIGGAHAKVSGVLEFDQRDNKKNTVTSYVSRVKNSKTGNYGAENCDEHNYTTATSITYLGTTEKYYKNASVSIPNLSTGKHTLTMYYMERGMWESNMAVAFNFPDNNELQVQKEVDLNKVDPDFKNCFTDQKIFNFTIQNQATHYGKTDAVGPNESGTQSQKVNLNESNIAAATPGNEYDYIFRRETNPWPDSGNENEQVLHWYARFTDTQSAAREKRRGILTLENPINIKDMRFLTFQVYVDPKDHGGDLSLNNLYLELLDENNVQKGSLGTTGINGATYGSVEVKTGAWVTVKLDLHKMKEQGGFNNNVKTIRVGDNYNRNIYFRDFTFIPKAVPSKMTGFTTDQKEIPDYGSAESGHLENAENAQYTSSNDTDTQLVDKDGRFVLEAGETVTFSNQFRRGSYISLKEDLNQNLYDTTWTVCENGQAVTSMKGDSESVTVTDTNKSLDKQEGSSPNDGRTEKIRPNDDQTGNSYTGNKPSADTIVFRSYKDPDENSSTLTKLKVKYVNTVKTGGLKIQKKAAEGETLTGTYTFKVTFNDVGGEGLEEKPIERTVTIKGESTGTITGIPVGTRYIIEEVGSNDGAKLQSVTVPDSCKSAHVIKNNTMVEGVIEKSKDPNNPELTAIFTNTQRTLINIEFDKLWKDANDTVLGTTNQPNEIYIQLQRRLATSQNDADWKPVNYPRADSPNYVTINRGTYGWLYTFSGLDQYQINTDKSQTDYVYRIVEGTVENDQFEQVAPGETITIKGNTYVVTAEATAKSEKDSETGATTTPAKVNGGTITGGSGKIVLTNKLQNPKFVLDIIKKDAEKDENSNDVLLSGVEFKLEKLVETTTEGESQWVVDKNYPFDSTNIGSITGTTDDNGKITPNPFTNLKPGTYRLTETKAHPGYNLLAQPIVIKFTQDGTCSIDGQVIPLGDKFTKSDNTYTMTLTVLNRKTPELPHTGADAPSLWLLIGMPLAVAGLLIFTFRYNRKGGRRH